MLVLSRKLGQRFQIGEEVRITVVKIDRNSVRIGIERLATSRFTAKRSYRRKPRRSVPRAGLQAARGRSGGGRLRR